MVSNSRKKSQNNGILLPLAGMKDSLKNMFSLDIKVTFGGSSI